MKRLLLAGAAAVALVSAAPANAQSAQSALTRYVFVAVDAVEVQYSKLTVTGVLDGESAARTVTVTFSNSSSGSSSGDQVAACERLALLAMTRPGQFRFEIQSSTSYSTGLCTVRRTRPSLAGEAMATVTTPTRSRT